MEAAAVQQSLASPQAKASRPARQGEWQGSGAPDFLVVGIGAAIGGVEALPPIVAALPARAQLCVVIAQHGTAAYRKLLADLVASGTPFEVRAIEDGDELRPQVIFVAPPNADAAVSDGRLRLIAPERGDVWVRPSIDRLFISLAAECGERAVGVILSGGGADGANGVRAIKAAGGVALAQDPVTTAHDSMPCAALETGAVDLKLSAERIGQALVTMADKPRPEAAERPAEGRATYETVIQLLAAHTGVAFTAYRRSPLHRRIRRRMALHRCSHIEDYHALLLRSPVEIEQLFKDALVSVTTFFRDPPAFAMLAAAVRQMIAERKSDDPLRVWVPGCATGEEAYSIAIVIAEALGEDLRRYTVRIFATDVDEAALRRARRGVYPATALQNVPPACRERYFVHSTDTVEVAHIVRGMLLFTSQDLIRDPPFSRIDLISCRNLLFYLGDALHQRLFPMFHYVLRPGGLLFLGASEAAPEDGLFEPVERRAKIYRRRPGPTSGRMIFPAYRPATQRGGEPGVGRRRPEVSPQEALRRHLAETYAPSAVLINQRLEIVQIHGDVRPFLALQQGKPALGILSLAEPSIRHHLRALIHRAVKGRGAVSSAPIRFDSDGERRDVVISAQLLAGDQDRVENLAVVAFELQRPATAPASAGSADEDPTLRLSEVERQLEITRESLEITVEELATANQELQSLNDELQRSNEELQTSNEGLQSANEELITVNEELQIKEQSLSDAAADVANILASVGLPMLVLDDRLAIKHYTAEAGEIMALRPADIGQPVTRVPRFFDLPRLEEILTRVIRRNEALTTSVAGGDKVYVMRGVPYRTDGKVVGAILSFVDVTVLERAKRDLQRQSEWLDSITNSVPALIGYLDRDMRLQFANRAFADYYGTDIVGRSIEELVGQRDLVEVRPYVERTLREVRTTWFESTVVTPNNGERALMIGLVPDRRDDRSVGGFFLLVVDISARKQTERALAESEERYRQLVEHAPDAILTHAEGRITFANPATAALFAAGSPEQLIGMPIRDLVEPEFHPLFDAPPDGTATRVAAVRTERIRGRRLDGERLDVELASIPHLRDGRPGAQVILRNITERVRVEERMRHLAHHDALTELPNRTYFQDRLRDALTLSRRRQDRVALHLLDLDFFKEVNDTHGHDVGDALLKEVAQRLQRAVRSTDTVARLGGDEFAVIQTAVSDAEDATVLAQKLIDAVDQRRTGFSESRPIGVTIGIALFPDDDDDPDQLLRKADIALYRAKDEGRNRYLFFVEQFNERTQDRRRLLAALPAAQRRAEFETHYQPIVRLDSGEVVAVEALLRWRHPHRGRLDAERFVDIAEACGQMRALTEWQLREVCSQLVEWRRIGLPPLRVAINLSLSQLRKRTLAQQVAHVLEEFGVEASCLEFELTEHAVVQPGSSDTAYTLGELHEVGARIALDDFGTGESSLMLLKRLPVDRIKIDRAFVGGIGVNAQDTAIVRGIVQLGLSLELGVTAEGVERMEQLDFLRDMGCPEAQGYFVASPMAPPSLVELLQSGARIPLQGRGAGVVAPHH